MEGGPGPERERELGERLKGVQRLVQLRHSQPDEEQEEWRVDSHIASGWVPILSIYKFQTMVGDGGKSLSRLVLAVSDAARSGEHSSVVACSISGGVYRVPSSVGEKRKLRAISSWEPGRPPSTPPAPASATAQGSARDAIQDGLSFTPIASIGRV